MNLSNSFPELEIFFERDEFTQDDLDDLFRLVKDNYPKDLSVAAMNFIKLRLIQFKKKSISNSKDRSDNYPKETSKKTKSQSNNKNEDKEKAKIDPIKKYKGYTLERLVAELEIPLLLINRRLKQNSYHLMKDILSNTQLGSLRKVILYYAQRKEHRDKVTAARNISVRKSNKYQRKSSGRYTAIEKFGIGKIIYIRQK